jgi:PAT family beta-lactamase induction signal transducer AmpG
MIHSEADEEIAGGALAPASFADAHRAPQVWLFLLLALPYGILNGGVSGTLLSFLLRREGVSVDSIANELSLLVLPGTLYFLWSPLVDFWMRRRTWFLLSAVVASVAVAAAFLMKSFASPMAVALLFTASAVMMLTSASCGGLVASLVPEEKKSQVSSMYQAGNLGGGALGGGGLMLLAQHMGRPLLGVVAAALLIVPAMAALALDEPPVKLAEAGMGLGAQLKQMLAEFKATFWRWSSLPALLMLLSPMGSGAAAGLLPGIATDYGLSGDHVAWLNGLAGGLLTAAGALLVVLIPGRIDTRLTYTTAGLVNALSIGVLCLGPTRPLTYLVGTVLYLLTVGACYALFTALVLKVIGGAGKSGGSRYAIAVSLGNAPVAYMAAVDGLGANWWGTRGLPGIDMGVSGLAAVGFLVWYWAKGSSRTVEL